MTAGRSVPPSPGPLFLIGGAEDRSREKTILRRVAQAARMGRTVIITTASDYPAELGKDYLRAFRDLGVEEALLLDIRRREDAAQGEARRLVEGAQAVFFTGGDQVKLVEVFQGTPLLETIRRRHREGAVLAGTSAGAAAAGSVTIYSGERVGLVKGAVAHGPAFGFLPEAIVDTHFVERGRILRLAQALGAGLSRAGLGVAEDTAVLALPDGTMEVLGSGPVAVLRAGGHFVSDHDDRPPGSLVSVEGLRLSLFAPGRRFRLGPAGPGHPPAEPPGGRRSGLGRIFKFLEPWHEYDENTARRS